MTLIAKYILLPLTALALTSCATKELQNMPEPADELCIDAFSVSVADTPLSRTKAIEGASTYKYDIEPGAAFGLFAVDDSGNTSEDVRNIKVSTSDGTTWQTKSTIIHKLGNHYRAYYPYSHEFDSCTTWSEVEARFTEPAADQSSSPATDWLYTDPTQPGVNGATELLFHHKYCRIDIFNSYTSNFTGAWASAYRFNVQTDDNGVMRYTYILNQPSQSTFSVSGTYNVGNANTGIRTMSYSRDAITVGNGYHAIVSTTRVQEDCAVDLGLPSGIKWAPFNVGTDSADEMTADVIEAAAKQMGWILSYGELWQKSNYSSTFQIDPSGEFLNIDVAGTDYDAAKQLWGGHWETPERTDVNELKTYCTITKVGETNVTTTLPDGSNVSRNVILRKATSKVNGAFIYFVGVNRYDGLFSAVNNGEGAYRIGTNGYYFRVADNALDVSSVSRSSGMMVRPVLKNRISKLTIISCIKNSGIDLGITVMYNGVQYRVLWSPVNFGVEDDVLSSVFGRKPTPDELRDNFTNKIGWRLAWGQLEKPEIFGTYNGVTTPFTSPVLADIGGNTDYDAPARYWGDGWRIPPKVVFDELVAKINDNTLKLEIVSGDRQYKITNNATGEYIYIYGNGHRTNNTYSASSVSTTAFLSSSNQSSGANAKVYNLVLSSTPSIKVDANGGKASGVSIRPVKLIPVL